MKPDAPPAASGFETTSWSLIAGAQQRGSAEAEAALAQLCSAYWRPVFTFIRRSTPDEHTAKDLTQGFFARFLEKDYVRDANQLRGRFRSFLLSCVKHHLANERDKQQARRRGGATVLLSLEQLIHEGGVEAAADSALSPDRCYERQWAYSVLGAARARLQAEFVAAGRAETFAVLERYLAGDRDEDPHHVAAERLGLSVDTVKKNVERMRRRFGHLLREEIAQTVLHPSEIEDELNCLRAALRG